MITSAPTQPTPLSTQSGFSLLELMVVAGIFLLFTAILIPRAAKFNDGVLLTNLAYDVGITIRNTRARALAVQSAGGSGSNDFDVAYGIRFDLDSPGEFFQYADTNDNGVYDAGSDEVTSQFTLNTAYEIADLCVTLSGTSECASDGGSDIQVVDIVYERPNPNAMIYSVDDGGSVLESDNDQATISISTNSGATSTITTFSTGQIAVDAE